MTGDQYLTLLLARNAVPTTPGSPALIAYAGIVPLLKLWANRYLAGISPSGSFAKGTAVAGTTDIDIFISIHNNVPETLEEIYEKLFQWSRSQFWLPRRQNVSIGISYGGANVDLVPGRLQPGSTTYHSLYRNKVGSWTQTNVGLHISRVKNSGRAPEIRALKIWRRCHGLKFPSFYVELTVINALWAKKVGNFAQNVWTVLEYLRDEFETACVMDPSNTNNWIDNDLTVAEKKKIAAAAAESLKKKCWTEVIW